MMFVVAFVLTLVENAYFGCLKASTDVKPVVIADETEKLVWISMVAGALFSALSYPLDDHYHIFKANPV